MTQFKVNDKVTVKAGCEHECAVLGDEVFDYLIITKIDGYYSYTAYLGGVKVDSCSCYKDDHLELYVAPVITWDTLKWKDVVVRDGKDRLVLDVRNDLVVLSYRGDFERHAGTFHKQELQVFGYTIKQPTPPPVEKLELTLDQIAEKFGGDVTNIKIKE